MHLFQLDETQPEKLIYHYWPFWKYKDMAAWCFPTRGNKTKTAFLLFTTFLGILSFFWIRPISLVFSFAYVYIIDIMFGSFLLLLFVFVISQYFYPVIFVDPECYRCFTHDYIIQRERLRLLGKHNKQEIDNLVLTSAQLQLSDLKAQYKKAFQNSELCPKCLPFQEMFDKFQLCLCIKKKGLTDIVMQEWDVTRRTAEFFDGVLGNLRTYGLTASVTLIGLSFQFKVVPLLLAGVGLNIGLLFVDKRYQSYLRATALYSIKLENEYKFGDAGLAHAINNERERNWLSRPEHTFRAIYVVLAIAGFIGFLSTFL